MINEKDYLNSFRLMGKEEQEQYFSRVERWTDETYPRLAARVDCWVENDVKDFDEGLLLASALVRARDFISQCQRYDVKKRLERLNGILLEIRERSGMNKVGIRSADDKKAYRAVVPEPKTDEEGKVQKAEPFRLPEVDGRRPDHLSEYIHLLPQELQMEATHLEDWYLELADYRGNAEKLAEHPDGHKDDIAVLAKKAVAAEDRILKFWKEVDRAYAVATGQAPEQEKPAGENTAGKSVEGKRKGRKSAKEIVGEEAGKETAGEEAKGEDTEKKSVRKRTGRKPSAMFDLNEGEV